MFKKGARVPSADSDGGDDDDDNISLTSTQESEHSEDHEFSVDRILAEKKERGEKRYLIQWTDYPIERASWEPEESIVDNSMLREWKTRKSRETNRLVTPFDVGSYEATVARLRREKESRVARREAKRILMGHKGQDSETIKPNSRSYPHQVTKTPNAGQDDDSTEVQQSTGPIPSTREQSDVGSGCVTTVSSIRLVYVLAMSRGL